MLKKTDHQTAKQSQWSLGSIFIFAYLLVLVICAANEALTNNGVIIPYVKVNQAYPLLVVTLLGLVYVVYKRKIKADIVTLLLFGRFVLCFVPALLRKMPDSYIGNLVVASFPFLIYLFFLNCNMDIERATSILVWFGLLIALQCIWAYLVIRQNNLATYNDLFYKNYFVIPAGATNNISAILLPLTILGDQTIVSKKHRIAYILLLLLALFLCKSRTGLILAVLYLLIKIIIKERGKHSNFKKVLLISLPLLLIAAVLVLMRSNLWDRIRSLLLGYSSSGGGLNALLSGRFSVFGNVLDHIKDHLIIGNGVTYEKLGFVRSHNVFLQIFYENGIVGLLGFVVFLAIVLYRIIKSRSKNRFYYALYVAMPFILINAMVEETMLGHFMVLFGLLYLADIKKQYKEII